MEKTNDKISIELGPYLTKALGEMQFNIINLVAERDALARQVQVLRMEIDSNKEKKKDKAEVK